MRDQPGQLRALVVDYGGVLTASIESSFTAWCDADDLDWTQVREVVTARGPDPAVRDLLHALERGQLTAAEFEQQLGPRLRTRSGGAPAASGLLDRMFAALHPDRPMVDVVRAARRSGLATALLSNSWGNSYDRAEWDDLFDAVVISGEVGLRKPDPQIYRLVADRLGVDLRECVFVDDLAVNVRAAVELGMVGVHHVSAEETVTELEALFARPLRGRAAAS